MKAERPALGQMLLTLLARVPLRAARFFLLSPMHKQGLDRSSAFSEASGYLDRLSHQRADAGGERHSERAPEGDAGGGLRDISPAGARAETA
jgi:hypothetical protein